MKTSAVYKITNTVTGDFYIGSSKNVKQRWAVHKCPSTWNKHPNNPMYLDMQKYGVDNFAFEILAEVEIDRLKETEQKFIEILKPTYNQMNAKGLDVERWKKYQKEYYQQNRKKNKEYQIEYYQQNRNKWKEYNKSEKRKKHRKEYDNQLCFYNSETLTLRALSNRFYRAGIEHCLLEAKKYLIK